MKDCCVLQKGNDYMEKVMGLIGLAKKAGKVLTGESAVKEAIRFGKAVIVFIAEDASENTKKSITDSCRYYDVDYYICLSKEVLGKAVGNEYNAAVCVTDEGFAGAMLKKINGGD